MGSMHILCAIWLLFVIINLNECNRTKTDVISDVASAVYEERLNETRLEYQRRVRDPNKHISIRLLRYFVFGGILQAISEDTGISRTELVTGGASTRQDQYSGKGIEGIHAAHVIRVSSINEKLKKENESLYTALANYIGHTQNVVKDVNVWRGIGGNIDLFQSSNLTLLAKIDFSGKLTDLNKDIVLVLQATFRKIVDTYVLMKSYKTSDTSKKKELEDMKETVYLVNERMLFENGTAGYIMVKDGNFTKRYNRKRSRSNG
ncbi:uncharacterized protein LOC125766432 [Anopheles funestus]|uniref:uncharacterized protein LOC125766432 n=1 Tax=Anopheles funestus TaxID=62324 RepID=UPI0020C6A249|nr:uncharacterized protein LOC125766432 [Anopheles funestus]